MSNRNFAESDKSPIAPVCVSLACRIGEGICGPCLSAKRRAAAAVAQGNRRALADRRRADIAYWLTQEPDMDARRARALIRKHVAAVGHLYPYGYEAVRKDLAGILQVWKSAKLGRPEGGGQHQAGGAVMLIDRTAIGASYRTFYDTDTGATITRPLGDDYLAVQALPPQPGPRRVRSRVRFAPGPGISWSNLTIAAAEGRRHGRRVTVRA